MGRKDGRRKAYSEERMVAGKVISRKGWSQERFVGRKDDEKMASQRTK